MYLKQDREGNLMWMYEDLDWQQVAFESGMDERTSIEEYTREELAGMTRWEFRFLLSLQESNEFYYPPFEYKEDNYDNEDVCRINAWLI